MTDRTAQDETPTVGTKCISCAKGDHVFLFRRETCRCPFCYCLEQRPIPANEREKK